MEACLGSFGAEARATWADEEGGQGEAARRAQSVDSKIQEAPRSVSVRVQAESSKGSLDGLGRACSRGYRRARGGAGCRVLSSMRAWRSLASSVVSVLGGSIVLQRQLRAGSGGCSSVED
jgi:hypothetical protein